MQHPSPSEQGDESNQGYQRWGDGDMMVAQAMNCVQIDSHSLAVTTFQQQGSLIEDTLDATIDSGYPQ